MPAMGPDKDYADRHGNYATDDILTLLATKYNVSRPDANLPFGVKLSMEWDQLQFKLREIVKEMVWLDHCANF